LWAAELGKVRIAKNGAPPQQFQNQSELAQVTYIPFFFVVEIQALSKYAYKTLAFVKDHATAF